MDSHLNAQFFGVLGGVKCLKYSTTAGQTPILVIGATDVKDNSFALVVLEKYNSFSEIYGSLHFGIGRNSELIYRTLLSGSDVLSFDAETREIQMAQHSTARVLYWNCDVSINVKS